MDSDGNHLIARAASGDREAFAALVRRWDRPLLRFLNRMLANDHLAEEARQLTFVRVLERGATFKGHAKESTWLFRVAYRIALDLRRRERLRRTDAIDGVDRPSADDDPAVAVGDDDERAHVRAALASLDAEDRALLWLRVADGQTFAAIAETLDTPESTVRLRFVRALGRLKRKVALERVERSPAGPVTGLASSRAARRPKELGR